MPVTTYNSMQMAKRAQVFGVAVAVGAWMLGGVFLLGGGGTEARGASSAYTFTPLNPISGDTDSLGLGINNSSKVIGQSIGTNFSAAYSVGGSNLQAFGTSSGGLGSANAVNDGGVAVGYYTPSSAGGNQLAFYSDTGSNLHSLPTFGGATSTAQGVNGNSALFEVVGQSQYAGVSGALRAFSWNNGASTLTPLDPTTGGVNGLGDTSSGAVSIANGLNAAGSIVGQASTDSGDQHAFLYSPSSARMYDLLTTSGMGSSSAAAINAGGVIVGVTDVVDGSGEHNRAFSYSGYNVSTVSGSGTDLALNGSFTDLGSLDGTDSSANGINSAGVVVGSSSTVTGQHAFIYQSGTMTDLNSLVTLPSGWTLDSATGINDAGAISGYADFSGHNYAFLLSPSSVPEPTSLGLIAMTIAATTLRRRR